jgi:hypothetical protein
LFVIFVNLHCSDIKQINMVNIFLFFFCREHPIEFLN